MFRFKQNYDYIACLMQAGADHSLQAASQQVTTTYTHNPNIRL